MSPLEAFTFLSFWASGLGLSKVEQAQISLSTEAKKSINIHCKIESTNFESEIVYWYRQKKNQALEHLVYVTSTTTAARNQVDGKNKIEARKDARMFTSTLTVNFIEKEDVGIYYCAGWSYYVKIFGDGTKLVVTDRRLDGDLFPKPTIFFPSVEEVKLHGAGTHLCLLQNFFPDAIKIQWKEKNVNTILESYQGNIIKTNDTYMKFSWLTLTKKAMDKEHVCIVKHENNKGGRDQQILFSPVKKEVATHACMKKESDTLQLQFANTSAYYTYLLLLLKSMIYFSIIAFCVFWRTGIFSDGKIF